MMTAANVRRRMPSLRDCSTLSTISAPLRFLNLQVLDLNANMYIYCSAKGNPHPFKLVIKPEILYSIRLNHIYFPLMYLKLGLL